MSIKVKAVGKERPRWCPRYSYAYTPKKTKDFEALIAAHFAVYMRNEGLETIDGAVSVDMTIYHKVPKSWSKKKREDALSGRLQVVKTPDLDNCVKSVLDGLNEVAFVDDKLVVQLRASRLYHAEDIINIKINPL